MKKKIIIIDGGPRKTFNTASMLQKIAEGAASVSEEIEVKTVRLYGMDYKGCMSCMACLERCPRQVQPAKLIEAVRLAVIRKQDYSGCLPSTRCGGKKRYPRRSWGAWRLSFGRSRYLSTKRLARATSFSLSGLYSL